MPFDALAPDPAPPEDAWYDPPGRVEFVHRSWPAEPAQLAGIRRELTRWVSALGPSVEQTADIVLAVDEAAANAMRHAYEPGEPGAVELTLWTEGATLCTEIVDHGRWRAPAEPTGESGRGIGIMNMMAEAVLIRRGSRGSRVLLRHRVPRPAGQPGASTSRAG
jgi:serine/threonine-protein kinase RsbW